MTKKSTATPSSIVIDGTTFVPADSVVSMGEKRIVVLQRGWVFIGNVEQTAEKVTITNAKNIRRWGTTMGLGELKDGPLRETTLDEAGTIECHPLSVVLMIAVDQSKW
jgi:hypothetical protein